MVYIIWLERNNGEEVKKAHCNNGKIYCNTCLTKKYENDRSTNITLLRLISPFIREGNQNVIIQSEGLVENARLTEG